MDLCICLDVTGSMNTFLDAIKCALKEIICISRIVGKVERYSVVGYKDYSEYPVISFSGWVHKPEELLTFIKTLKPFGGADIPEAVKTAACFIQDKCDKETIVLWYTDSQPHHAYSRSLTSHVEQEKSALKDRFDWVTICKDFRASNIHVYTFLSYYHPIVSSFFCMLAKYTNGQVYGLKTTKAEDIAKHTIGLFLNILDQAFTFDDSIICISYTSFDESLVIDENNSDKKLPFDDRISDALLSIQHDAKIKQANAIVKTNIIQRFAEDATYRKVVYEVFDNVLNDTLVTSLNYNTLFATLWREICKRNDVDRHRLVSKMGETISKLPQNKKEQMKQFIENSYNQTDLIESELKEYDSWDGPRLFIEKENPISRDELLEIGRSCHSTVVAKVATIITGIYIQNENHDQQHLSLPLCLEDKKLFTMLPHLLVPGTLYSQRHAAIIACLAVCSDSILKTQGLRYLESIKGKWIQFDKPENSSYDFAKLMLRCPFALTEEEYKQLQYIHDVGGVLLNQYTNVDIVTGYTSNKSIREDYKIKCNECNEKRSFTLITEDGVCGLCVDGDTDVKEPSYLLKDNESYMCECSQCKVHYAVVRVECLIRKPKCHYCRNNEDARNIEESPYVTCKECSNKFMCSTPNETSDFTCAPCAKNTKGLLETHKVTVRDYYPFQGMGFTIMSDEFFKQKSVCKALQYTTRHDNDTVADTHPKYHEGKLVRNHPEVIANIQSWIQKHTVESTPCMMCYEDIPNKHIERTCNRKGCNAVACSDCLNKWYGDIRPGCTCTLTHFLCPFCKSQPAFCTIKRYNRELCMLKYVNVAKLDPRSYYAWCVKCYAIVPTMDKSCSTTAPQLVLYCCDQHNHNDKTKECPSCGVMTEKSSGCDHITCTSCQAHWCFQCGKESSYDEIYKHMSMEHGGYGFEDNRIEDDGFE